MRLAAVLLLLALTACGGSSADEQARLRATDAAAQRLQAQVMQLPDVSDVVVGYGPGNLTRPADVWVELTAAHGVSLPALRDRIYALAWHSDVSPLEQIQVRLAQDGRRGLEEALLLTEAETKRLTAELGPR